MKKKPGMSLLAGAMALTAGFVAEGAEINGTELCSIISAEASARNYTEHCVASGTSSGFLVELYRGSNAFQTYSECSSYLLVPAENTWSRTARGAIYLFALLYCFLGIAIVADVFMNAIEEITSKERERTIVNPATGKEEVVKELVWNKTVANLTLMALGSSAPEILLSIIGVVTALGEPADELGPSTIVGSAAFNLLVISAVCVTAPPAGEVRRVAEMGVFMTTAFFSVWAYVWLLVILDFHTKEVVDVWEALVTFLQFPVLVFLAYGFDKHWKFGKNDSKVSPEPQGDQHSKLSYMFYRTQGIRMISGGARLTMRKPKHEAMLASVDEEVAQVDQGGSTSDPYAVVKYGAVLKKTKWKLKNLSPQWDQVLEIEGPVDLDREIDLEVYDHDELSKDDFMGRARLPLSNLDTYAKGVWVQLCTAEGLEDSRRGQVHIRVYSAEAEGYPGDLRVHVIEGRDLIGMEKQRKHVDRIAKAAGSRVRSVKDKVRAKQERWSDIKRLWAHQFFEACKVNGDKDEDGNESPPSGMDMLMHFLTFFWKFFFALIPPPEWGGGWVAFNVALIFIGLVTAIVGELAALFGCVVGLKASVTAITFVALGTSLPDTFASRLAAVHEETADAAIGNITGSNSVNVFLGIGLPWLIGALYQEAQGKKFIAKSPGFSLGVVVFIILATCCLGVLMLRGKMRGCGELGGPSGLAKATAFLSVCSWFIYIIVSSLRSYDHIKDLWGPNS